MKQTFSNDPAVERSLRHSLADGVAFSLMAGAGESYFSAFALYLRATTAQVGLLASVPTLLASFLQLLSVWIARRTGHRKAIIVVGALLQAVALLLIIVLPVSFPGLAFPILLLCAVAYFAGPNLGSPQWGSLMGDLVPAARRGRFFALRTRLATISTFAALLGAGAALQSFSSFALTYWGFVTIFGFACAARMVSAYHLWRMLDPPRQVALEAPVALRLWKRLRSSQLVGFSVFFASMQLCVAIASPYFIVYMLRDLHFSYLEWTINTACSICFQFLTLTRWGRISDLFGNRLILLTTGMILPLLPSLWIISTNYGYLLGVQALSGLVWAGFTLSATNFVFDLTPADRRATLMAYHNVLAAVGVFIGAAIGGYLATHLPRSVVIAGTTYQWTSVLYGVFAVSTAMRLLVAGIGLPRLKEVRTVRAMSVAGAIFRVTRLHPLSGAIFEAVGFHRRRGRKTPRAREGAP